MATGTRLQNKMTFVTGASRRIGKAIAMRLAAEGACVAVNYHTNSESADELRRTIVAQGGKVMCIQADVADHAQVNRMAQTVLEEFQQIDILVNNAGTALHSPILETAMAEFNRMIGVNLRGVLNCVQAVAGGMVERKYGRILNIASVAGLGNSAPGISAYAATKSALVSLTKRLALELGSYNITVNSVVPGRIRADTPMQAGGLPEIPM